MYFHFHSVAMCPKERALTPTITTFYPWNINSDVSSLYWAMKGWGTDEKALIDVLTHRTYRQRNQIADAFTRKHSNFRSWLFDEISGFFYNIIYDLMYLPTHVMAYQLVWAVKGAGTNEQTLIDVLVSMNGKEMAEVKYLFKRKSGYSLRSYVRDDTSGELRVHVHINAF